jgi:hypothetical protein
MQALFENKLARKTFPHIIGAIAILRGAEAEQPLPLMCRVIAGRVLPLESVLWTKSDSVSR